MFRRVTIPTERDRTYDRQPPRQGGVVSTPDGDGRARLKVHTSDISGGQSGNAYLMLPKGTSPFFIATTLSLPLFVPNGMWARVDDEVWAFWHPPGQRYVLTSIIMKKQFCWFKADADFTQSDDEVEGTIQTQWGYGEDHASTAATFKNQPTSVAGPTYMFKGDTDDWGKATYSGSGTIWYMDQFECETA